MATETTTSFSSLLYSLTRLNFVIIFVSVRVQNFTFTAPQLYIPDEESHGTVEILTVVDRKTTMYVTTEIVSKSCCYAQMLRVCSYQMDR